MERNATPKTVKPGHLPKAQIHTVLAILGHEYPNAHIALLYTNPWELLVAVILSAQCTDTRVNSVTKQLFAKYPSLDDYVRATQEEFEKDIKPTGFFRNKSKYILATARIIKNTYKGVVPQSLDKLLLLPGVARKTAHIVLGNAYGIVEGIAVDTHVQRISQRLRLVDITTISGKKPMYVPHTDATIDYYKATPTNSVEQALMAVLPRKNWFIYTYQVIDHGRAVCRARNPICTECALKSLCPASRVQP